MTAILEPYIRRRLTAIQIPHIPLNYIGDAIEGMIRYKMPTMALTLNFYAEIGETEWLLTQTSMQVSRNRRFDMNILVRNETG